MFKTRARFKKHIKKTVKQGDKWYCFFESSIRQGNTEQEAINNAYNLWAGRGKK